MLLFIVNSYKVYASNTAQTYIELKQINQQQHLFFEHNKLNLSGITLLSLLADLGIREQSILSNSEKRHIDKTDEKLSLALYRISSLSHGNQLKLAANTFASFEEALYNNTLPQYIDEAMPQFNNVVRLREAINKYKQMQHLDWPKLNNSFNPKLGQGHKEVKKLRRKLIKLGDLSASNTSKNRLHIFDFEIINGLKQFQQRNGFKPSGKLDNKTRQALNQSMNERVTKLQINLWRWLSLPRTPPSKYIIVNIPSYDLALVEKGRSALSMNVIVGKPTNQTPIMVTAVSSVTVNPTWTPTRNIINNDLLPLHNKNNSALKSSNFYLAKGYGTNTLYKEITTDLKEMLKQYRLVQMPGRNNALGKVRFNIKNNNAIYLHDTPKKSLFAKHNRALSHGCIRLEQADTLLNHLLNKNNNVEPRLFNRENRKTRHVKLPDSIPVFITYQTAWVDSTGQINWRHDLYRKDQKIIL